MSEDAVSIEENSVYFTSGWVRSARNVLISAKLNDFSEADFSRIYMFEDEEWGVFELDDVSVKSICYRDATDSIICMGKDGTIVTRHGSSIHTDRIASVKSLGFLNQIKVVGTDVFVCGYGGQIYKLDNGGWSHYDAGVLEPVIDGRSLDLQDVDGVSADRLYAVGTGGSISLHDDNGWRRVASPTNRHLLRVLAVSDDEIYVSGTGGTLLVGSQDTWRDISYDGADVDFWGMALYRDELYLAHATGLLKWKDGVFTVVRPDPTRVVTCHRLHANDGVLWSFGLDDLFWFDGKRWTEVICPDNDPSQY